MSLGKWLFLPVILLLYISCSKDDGIEESEYGIAVELTNESLYGVYYIDSYSSEIFEDLNEDGVYNINLLFEIEECLTDNYYDFSFKASYQILEGGVACGDSIKGNGEDFELKSGGYNVVQDRILDKTYQSIEFYNEFGSLTESFGKVKLYRIRGTGRKTIVGEIHIENGDVFRTLVLREN